MSDEKTTRLAAARQALARAEAMHERACYSEGRTDEMRRTEAEARSAKGAYEAARFDAYRAHADKLASEDAECRRLVRRAEDYREAATQLRAVQALLRKAVTIIRTPKAGGGFYDLDDDGSKLLRLIRATMTRACAEALNAMVNDVHEFEEKATRAQAAAERHLEEKLHEALGEEACAS